MAESNYRYKYSCPDYGQSYEDACEFGSDFDVAVAPTRVAEDAARHNHYGGDGLDSEWPKVFELWSVTGHGLRKFSVEREAVPEFHATRVK